MKAVSDYTVEDNASNLNQALESLSSPGDRMKLIAERYGDSALATTSFGAQSAVMLHLLKEHAPQIPIIFILILSLPLSCGPILFLFIKINSPKRFFFNHKISKKNLQIFPEELLPPWHFFLIKTWLC